MENQTEFSLLWYIFEDSVLFKIRQGENIVIKFEIIVMHALILKKRVS